MAAVWTGRDSPEHMMIPSEDILVGYAKYRRYEYAEVRSDRQTVI